ncbi:NAD(P)-dependent oxidoreductase [Bacillus cereus group sp. MYBKT111-2]|uniref:NAD(P)-dependent oxidoreductase n=1 Tax=Bacillus cereus group sp. MYBKT111-2 TaxID=3450598 RepID=UPI00370F6900
MKIAVFGATGGIGKFVVKHALEKGYEVNAYARNPHKLNLSHDKLTVFPGDLNEYENIKHAITGCNAVIIALGVSMKFTYKSMDSLEGHKNIIKAMKELGVSRIIDWATPSVHYSKDARSFITIIPGIMAGILFSKAKKEIIAITDAIQSANLDWTIVRFMAPKDSPYTGKVKVGFGDKKMSFNIAREDIAAFMVKQVESSEYMHSMPIIGS